MKSNFLNGIKIFCPENSSSLVDFIKDKKKILVAVNAEKILHSNEKVKKLLIAILDIRMVWELLWG